MGCSSRTTALIAAVLWATVAPAAERATFVFELDGVPVGTVALSFDAAAATYRYTSLHLYTRDGERGRRLRSAQYAVDREGRDLKTGRYLESLALWRGPRGAPCIQVQEELGGRTGALCTTRVDGEIAAGTLRGERWEAVLREGRLHSLQMGVARFERVRAAKLDAPPDLLRRSWVVDRGDGPLVVSSREAAAHVAWSPPAAPRAFASRDEARALSRRVHASFEDQTPSGADFAADDGARTAGCLGHARRYVEWARRHKRDAFIVHGLVASEDGGHVSPHAWVRVAVLGGWYDVDPTLEVEVTAKTHVALGVQGHDGKGGAGRLWLALFSGELEVRRAPAS